MTNYNVVCKIVRSSLDTIESALQTYLNSVDSGKTIRSISTARYGNDSLLVTIIHDA